MGYLPYQLVQDFFHQQCQQYQFWYGLELPQKKNNQQPACRRASLGAAALNSSGRLDQGGETRLPLHQKRGDDLGSYGE